MFDSHKMECSVSGIHRTEKKWETCSCLQASISNALKITMRSYLFISECNSMCTSAGRESETLQFP